MKILCMVVAFYDNGTEAVGLQYPDINYVIRTTLLFFTLINYSVVHISRMHAKFYIVQ